MGLEYINFVTDYPTSTGTVQGTLVYTPPTIGKKRDVVCPNGAINGTGIQTILVNGNLINVSILRPSTPMMYDFF